MNRQRLILAVLLVLLAVSVIWSYRSAPRQKDAAQPQAAAERRTAPQPTPQAKTAAGPAASPAPPSSDTVRLDLLERPREKFSGYRRNLFQPIFYDEVARMKKQVEQQKAEQAKAQQKQPPPVLPPIPEPPPPDPVAEARRELEKFVFLGFLKKDKRMTIFLSRDKDIVLVRAGDRFKGKYEVLSITDQELTIGVAGTEAKLTIQLHENKPLSKIR